MKKENENITDDFVQKCIDSGCHNIIEFIRISLVSWSRIMQIKDVMAANKAFAVMQYVFANRQEYMSKKAIKVWEEEVALVAKRKNIDFEDAMSLVPSPAQQLFDQILPCIKDEGFRTSVFFFISCVFLYESARGLTEKSYVEKCNAAANQLFGTTRGIRKSLIELSEHIVSQVSLQYNFNMSKIRN